MGTFQRWFSRNQYEGTNLEYRHHPISERYRAYVGSDGEWVYKHRIVGYKLVKADSRVDGAIILGVVGLVICSMIWYLTFHRWGIGRTLEYIGLAALALFVLTAFGRSVGRHGLMLGSFGMVGRILLWVALSTLWVAAAGAFVYYVLPRFSGMTYAFVIDPIIFYGLYRVMRFSLFA